MRTRQPDWRHGSGPTAEGEHPAEADSEIAAERKTGDARPSLYPPYLGTPEELEAFNPPKYSRDDRRRYHADRRAALRADRSLYLKWAKPHADAALRIVERRPDGEIYPPPKVALRYTYCPEYLREPALRLILQGLAVREMASPLGLRPPPRRFDPMTQAAPADRFKSSWERRLAAALTRLKVRWTYEPDRLPYIDHRGHGHSYTPDFRLDDLHRTYVEVKGIHGADNADNLKMWHVLRQNAVTLLLWDAAIIEMVEDMQRAEEVEGLLSSTRLAA